MLYFCCDKLRRDKVKDSALNGIDYLEVLDHDAPTDAERQRKLFVHFINNLTGPSLTQANVRIEGGERIRNIVVANVTAGTGSDSNVLTVDVNQPGDFSMYTLRLVEDVKPPQPPDGFDPMLSAVDFSFKVECPTDFDCKSARVCPPEPLSEPEIDYLAKDYASFRRLMLDRMVALMPQWRERNPADLGVALVEMLAYVGDHLSYQQDAVATEAYLGTARRRVSVRRHARLVDYFMHDGCNARAWVAVRVSAGTDGIVIPGPREDTPGTVLLTKANAPDGPLPPDQLGPAVNAGAVVFETMHDLTLRAAHNEIHFYTWGDDRCCLPKGATRAALRGHFSHLQRGDVLIFEEVIGPQTGKPEDADPSHRHSIRLMEVVHTKKELRPLTDPLNGQLITEIAWAEEDALPFPLCLWDVSVNGDPLSKQPASIALGNVVLADHGLTIKNEALGAVPQLKPPASGSDHCQRRQPEPIPPRFRPQLKERPLTQAATVVKTRVVNGKEQTQRLVFDPDAPASTVFEREWKDVLPAITLNTETWRPQRDLLASDRFAKEFVVEVEADGTPCLRFGDDQHGSRPGSGAAFTATYRVGNGVAGNVGAEAIAHIVSSDSAIVAVRNPLPARGGIEPESTEDVRQRAPDAFRTQERAVTEEDYAEVTERDFRVQQAAATFRWTGSWHTAFVTVDRLQGLPVDDAFETDIRRRLERYRMAGYDLEVDRPRFVPLDMEMNVCVMPDYFRSDVKAALLRVFSNQVLPDGLRGVFHPDNFTFGQTVYLSRLYMAAQAVAGVASVQITKFERQGTPDQKALDEGKLLMNRLEIARLDNDPNFPEHGVFRLDLGGGK